MMVSAVCHEDGTINVCDCLIVFFLNSDTSVSSLFVVLGLSHFVPHFKCRRVKLL